MPDVVSSPPKVAVSSPPKVAVPSPPKVAVPVTIGEHAAQLVAFAGEQATLISPEAAAPGARLFCKLAAGAGGADAQVLKVKVHRCVKVDEGFRISSKAFDLRRSLRESLQQQFASEPMA